MNRLALVETDPALLVSGGGDPYLMLWDWYEGKDLQRIDLGTLFSSPICVTCLISHKDLLYVSSELSNNIEIFRLDNSVYTHTRSMKTSGLILTAAIFMEYLIVSILPHSLSSCALVQFFALDGSPLETLTAWQTELVSALQPEGLNFFIICLYRLSLDYRFDGAGRDKVSSLE